MRQTGIMREGCTLTVMPYMATNSYAADSTSLANTIPGRISTQKRCIGFCHFICLPFILHDKLYIEHINQAATVLLINQYWYAITLLAGNHIFSVSLS